MIVNCEAVRLIHRNENYQLVECMPMGDDYDNLSVHPQYHTITVKDSQHRLSPNKRYELDLSELPPTRYGTSYLLLNIPALSFNDINDITDDMDYELLTEIMSEQQAENVHHAYPNFVRLILSGRKNEIDVDNIYNVSNKRLEQYVRKVGRRYNTFLLRKKCKPFELSTEECTKLINSCGDMEDAIECVYNDPYYALISICNRGFRNADVCILRYDATLKTAHRRIEYMLNYAVQRFEEDGSTYVNAISLGDYIYTIDADILPMIKDVAIESDMIHYEEDKNIIQRKSTYEQELFCAEAIKHIRMVSEPLDWDYREYTTIKDGELTQEQRNVLRGFCEHNFIMLDAPSGTGKTSSLMALIHMIENNDMTYCMMSPTGKAASRLSEQTGRPASTIHRATMGNMLSDVDVIIIDESSMLSVSLMYMVFMALDDNYTSHRYVFVGDSAQIPSIGLGRVFKDMGNSGTIPKYTLTKCFRFEEGGASYVSALTRQGKMYLTTEQMNQSHITMGKKKDYEFIKFNGDINQIVDVYMGLVNDGVNPKDIMLLVPYNIGAYGSIKLNNLIQSRINPLGCGDIEMKTKHNDVTVMIHKGDLVMNVKNNYNATTLQGYEEIAWDDSFTLEDAKQSAVYNGQVGRVIDARKESGVISGNMLIVDIEGENFIYTTKDINNLHLSYSSNPYKFQGSQCKYVINVVIGAHERAWNRQLLYTSQTRMTDKLIEIGEPEIIMEAINKTGDDNRNTRLYEFLALTI